MRCSTFVRPSSALRRRAISAIAGLKSLEIRRPLSPRIGAISNPTSPWPAASSSTVSPGFGASSRTSHSVTGRRDLLPFLPRALPARGHRRPVLEPDVALLVAVHGTIVDARPQALRWPGGAKAETQGRGRPPADLSGLRRHDGDRRRRRRREHALRLSRMRLLGGVFGERGVGALQHGLRDPRRAAAARSGRAASAPRPPAAV